MQRPSKFLDTAASKGMDSSRSHAITGIITFSSKCPAAALCSAVCLRLQHRGDQKVSQAGIQRGWQNVDLMADSIASRIRHSGLSNHGLPYQPGVHWNIPRNDNSLLDQQQAHDFFPAHLADGQLIGVRQVELRAFKFNYHSLHMDSCGVHKEIS